jgi:protein involved in polysaccharide export with SLBB domain
MAGDGPSRVLASRQRAGESANTPLFGVFGLWRQELLESKEGCGMRVWSRPQGGRVMAVVLFALSLFALVGCQSVPPPAISIIKSEEPAVPAVSSVPEDVRVSLAPGDSIEVKFFYTPELNETQTVRPDGNIALLLVGEVRAEGKTPAEMQDELVKRYSSHLRNPQVTVIVRSLEGRRVYVGGEVKTPGVIPMPGQLTAMEAIMQAGGFNLLAAELENVVIIRYKERQRFGYMLNMKEALAGRDYQPFYLESRDIIYVPRTRIAEVNQWIDQHINKMLPQINWFYVPLQ